jgi:protein-disulfide isomerase
MTPDSNGNNPEIAALRNQCFTLLMALIVVSGTLTVFLYRQASITGSDLTQAKQLNVMVTQNEASIGSFVQQLVAYGQTHPDFVPVLKKYGLTGSPAAPVAIPVAPKK